ncbi:hypothetical protein WCX72_09890 [Sulfurimonas sp. HSL1-6]|uniref:hypothetical protein n=1 Tax=Thiomicrolovo immobilis TaxID=3131935 RepID=UPI0031F7C0AC
MNGRMKRYHGMMKTVLEYLAAGNELSQSDAADLWREFNLRNKISQLGHDDWPILRRDEPSKRGGKYKVYYLDPDRSKWPYDPLASA